MARELNDNFDLDAFQETEALQETEVIQKIEALQETEVLREIEVQQEPVAIQNSDELQVEEVRQEAEMLEETEVEKVTTKRKVSKAKTIAKTKGNSFYDLNYNELDKDLSPAQLKEWTSIYASFRSRTPLSGTIVGVETHRLAVVNKETNKAEQKQILCVVIMDFRVKVIIHETEIWYNDALEIPDFVIRKMIGGKIDYVITNVDRQGECALASRRLALGYRRNQFFRDRNKSELGKILKCNVLAVGPSKIIFECNGFDLQAGSRELSYTAIVDLRSEYHPGQEISAKLVELDEKDKRMHVSVKEVNPNPFDGADIRHPVRSRRKAVISGTYAGGVFCRLTDDTNCLCLYSPELFSTELYIGDTVMIAITRFDYERQLVYGKIMSKI